VPDKQVPGQRFCNENMLNPCDLIRSRGLRKQFFSKSPNIRHCLRVVWLSGAVLLFGRALCGQTFRLSSASASRGDLVTIELSLESPAGKGPSALQWDAMIPIAQLSLINDKILAGSTAQEAGKSLNCSVKQKTAEVQTFRCILAGGQNSLSNGTIAVLRLKIPANAQAGEARIRVQQGIAVSRDLKQSFLETVETNVTIRR